MEGAKDLLRKLPHTSLNSQQCKEEHGYLVSDKREVVGGEERDLEEEKERKRGRKYNSRIIFGMDGDVEE